MTKIHNSRCVCLIVKCLNALTDTHTPCPQHSHPVHRTNWVIYSVLDGVGRNHKKVMLWACTNGVCMYLWMMPSKHVTCLLQVLSFFVLLAQKLQALNNYNTMCQIISGICLCVCVCVCV